MDYNPIQTNTIPLSKKLINTFWISINKTIFRFTPKYFSIFRKYRVLLLKLFGAKIDWNVSINPTAIIEYPWNLSIKNKSSIGAKCWIYALDYINIDEYSCIGDDVKLLTGSHDVDSYSFNLITKPINIGKGCWIATSSTILPGIHLGDYTVVAANSVVTKTTLEYDIVGGNPAIFLKKRKFR